MSFIKLTVTNEASADLQNKKGMLETALLATVGELGDKLYELVIGNLSGTVLQSRTGKLASAVMIEAAAFIGQVCQTAVAIPEDSEEWLIGMVHEYGGLGWYIIEPVNATVLAWMGPEGMVFARRVNHPPAEERSYMRSALAWMEADAVDQIKTTIAEVLAA